MQSMTARQNLYIVSQHVQLVMNMDKEPSPEFVAGVQTISALMGLTLAFKEKIGDEALKITQGFAAQMGTMIGNNIKEAAGVTGSGIQDVERVYHIWLDPMFSPNKADISTEANKLTFTRDHPVMCPAMLVAKQMNLPLEMVCTTVANQVFSGIAKSVNPGAVYSNVQLSEQKCIDTIEIL